MDHTFSEERERLKFRHFALGWQSFIQARQKDFHMFKRRPMAKKFSPGDFDSCSGACARRETNTLPARTFPPFHLLLYRRWICMHCACCDIAAHSDPKNVNKSRRPCSRATKKRERSDHGALLLLGKQALCSPCVSAASLKIYVRFQIPLCMCAHPEKPENN